MQAQPAALYGTRRSVYGTRCTAGKARSPCNKEAGDTVVVMRMRPSTASWMGPHWSIAPYAHGLLNRGAGEPSRRATRSTVRTGIRQGTRVLLAHHLVLSVNPTCMAVLPTSLLPVTVMVPSLSAYLRKEKSAVTVKAVQVDLPQSSRVRVRRLNDTSLLPRVRPCPEPPRTSAPRHPPAAALSQGFRVMGYAFSINKTEKPAPRRPPAAALSQHCPCSKYPGPCNPNIRH